MALQQARAGTEQPATAQHHHGTTPSNVPTRMAPVKGVTSTGRRFNTTTQHLRLHPSETTTCSSAADSCPRPQRLPRPVPGILAPIMRIQGQVDALRTLRDAFRTSRLHHAWVFAGPPGIGKRTVAEAFAHLLLDPARAADTLGMDTQPTGSDEQRLLDAGTHPDLHVIRRELAAWSDNAQLRERKQMTISIDLLREHIIGGRTGDGKVHDAPAYRRPVMGHAKVFIIDEAERLDRPGQNALLKTLEEPPPNTTFVLVTDRPQRLLPTIHSRCQVLHMAPLDEQAMHAWFEDAGIREGDRPWLASWAKGAPGMAAQAQDHGLKRWNDALGPILDQLDEGVWVPDAAESMQAWIDTWTDDRLSENPKASREAVGRDGTELLLRMMASRVSDALLRCADAGDVHGAARQGVVADLLAETEQRIGSSLNRRHVFDSLVASWAAGQR